MAEFIEILDTGSMSLEELKKYRYAQIDNKTSELIAQGFVFDSHTFSMSTNAQINWSNFPNLPDELFPLNVMDLNEDLYSLALADKLNFYLAALNYKNAQLQSGSALKAQIKAAVDVPSVNAITDNR